MNDEDLLFMELSQLYQQENKLKSDSEAFWEKLKVGRDNKEILETLRKLQQQYDCWNNGNQVSDLPSYIALEAVFLKNYLKA